MDFTLGSSNDAFNPAKLSNSDTGEVDKKEFVAVSPDTHQKVVRFYVPKKDNIIITHDKCSLMAFILCEK